MFWVKSSVSGSNGDCVEVAQFPERYVAVRNSRHPTGAKVLFTPREWDAFIAGVKLGEFDEFGEEVLHMGKHDSGKSSDSKPAPTGGGKHEKGK